MKICPFSVLSALGIVGGMWSAGLAQAAQPVPASFTVPVLVVHYFPTNGTNIDLQATGDWGASLAATREKTRRQTREVLAALEEGSRYQGWRNKNAQPALKYTVAGSLEFLRPLPTFAKRGHRTPMTDYNQIAVEANFQDWVENKGVREIWVWGYHGGKVDLWESNMASPHGDVSNSDRDPKDLPVFRQTYTVYHYNYQRGASEAVEDHMHQIEAVLNHVDGRDRTPPESWPELLFWGRFVGSDRSHKIVRPGCGWAHYPPNAASDYDWANPRPVLTDMDDWKPDGTGAKALMDSSRWGGNSLRWFVYWMQHLPGANNGLNWKGQRLQNWWVFLGDYDLARSRKLSLVEDEPPR
jgi:hypothetical protein